MENTKVKGFLLGWNPENADWNYKEACLKVKKWREI